MTALLGANVVFTDPEELLPILKSNIQLNCPTQQCEVVSFDWYAFLPLLHLWMTTCSELLGKSATCVYCLIKLAWDFVCAGVRTAQS